MEMAKITPDDVDAIAYTKGISLPFSIICLFILFSRPWYGSTTGMRPGYLVDFNFNTD